MLESTLEKAVRKYVTGRGGRFYKWVCPGESGVPDRIMILPGGHVYFIELKRPGRKDGLSPRQKKIFQVLTKLGCQVLRINSLDEIKILLKEAEGQNGV